MDMQGNKIYAVDFDNTLSFGKWPEVGEPNLLLIEFLKNRKAAGARIILNSCRCGKPLADAIEFCKQYGLVFDTINENLPELVEAYGEDSRKINADCYIDDKALNTSTVALILKGEGYES